jgi:glycerol-3-phosphate dehydrogenase (NAD(P)+)
MDNGSLHERARRTGVNPIVYWTVRAILQAFFLVYFRMRRHGCEHIPREGPVIVAANHRSFLDPFVIGMMSRRPMYYVAKKEIFANRWLAWLLSSLGAFPVDRGAGDAETIRTARTLLARGEIVLIFPEGTRIRPGSLGTPRRGVGRLALESGAPVVPVAVIGTEDVRHGWRIRPRKVRTRAGRPLRFPTVENASPALAGAVTDRIWPCVMLQWEWLGGLPPIRRAAVIGAGSWGTSLAVALARAGYEVELGCRTADQAERLRQTRVNERYLPGVELPDRLTVSRARDLELGGHDLICLAVPAGALPAVLGAQGERIPVRAGLLVCSKGLVAPLGTPASAFAAERCRARAIATLGGPARAADILAHGASVVVGSGDRGFARQLAEVLTAAGLDATISSDVTGVELAGCAKNVAALAAVTAVGAAGAGPSAAGAAAGKVLAEIDAIGRSRGARSETFVGLAGAGDLVASVLASESRNRRAAELIARGVHPAELEPLLGHAVEAVQSVPLLARVAREQRIPVPAIDGLAALIEGRIDPVSWAEGVIEPRRPGSSRGVRAA